jgi:6-phosphogluconolactonase
VRRLFSECFDQTTSVPLINITTVVVDCARFAFVANSGSNNVSAYLIDNSSGALTAVAGSPFATAANPSAVTVDPNGQFAYVVNAGSNNVSAYTIDTTTGAPTAIAGSPFAAGANPSGIVFDYFGTEEFAYVVNAGSNNVSAYAVNTTTGALTPIAGSPFATGTGPGILSIDSSGYFAYLANYGSASVSAFSINATTGALTAVPGSPFATGANPYSVTLPVDTFNPFGYLLGVRLISMPKVPLLSLGNSSGGLRSIRRASRNRPLQPAHAGSFPACNLSANWELGLEALGNLTDKSARPFRE